MGFNARKAQTRLKNLGYYTGAIDNDFGPASWGALLCYAARSKGSANCVARGRAIARAPEWTSVPRICHFVAETCHESGRYTRMREGMSYSTAQRIRDTWPSRFPNLAAAQPYVRNPVALANKVYARPEEGNTQPGDGWRFRGGGDIQTTFRNGFKRASADVGIDLVANPDRIAEPSVSILTALGFWRRNGIFAYVDRGEFQRARSVTNTGKPDTPRSRINGVAEVAAERNRLLDLFY